jgi:hypothetical protein
MSGIGDTQPILHDPTVPITDGTSLILQLHARKRKGKTEEFRLAHQHRPRLPLTGIDERVYRPAIVVVQPAQALYDARLTKVLAMS